MKRILVMAALMRLLAGPSAAPASASPFSPQEPTPQATTRAERNAQRRARRNAKRQDAEELALRLERRVVDDRAVLLQAWRDSVERMQKVTPQQRQQLCATPPRASPSPWV